jgi:hypothetical protein
VGHGIRHHRPGTKAALRSSALSDPLPPPAASRPVAHRPWVRKGSPLKFRVDTFHQATEVSAGTVRQATQHLFQIVAGIRETGR